MSKTRDAAKRLRRYKTGSDDELVFSDLKQVIDDKNILADTYLAEHAADDEEEIDEGWLIRCGAEWKNWFYAYSECQYEELTIEAGNTYLIIDDEDVRLLGGEPIANIKTRGRFRQLYFLLSGEELQEGK